jgi:hypothetical protein
MKRFEKPRDMIFLLQFLPEVKAFKKEQNADGP